MDETELNPANRLMVEGGEPRIRVKFVRHRSLYRYEVYLDGELFGDDWAKSKHGEDPPLSGRLREAVNRVRDNEPLCFQRDLVVPIAWDPDERHY